MPETITIRECRKIIDSGETFSYKRVTYDRQKRKGGKVEECLEARKFMKRWTVDGERWTDEEISEAILEEINPENPKDPRHFDNYTRNIQKLVDGRPIRGIFKLHPPLLIEFNGMKVTP